MVAELISTLRLVRSCSEVDPEREAIIETPLLCELDNTEYVTWL
uniref:Uncharacterized protein n=1 Tax=Arundo donax TaxID=35708 RepID=A0A0A8YG97_ARUDO